VLPPKDWKAAEVRAADKDKVVVAVTPAAVEGAVTPVVEAAATLAAEGAVTPVVEAAATLAAEAAMPAAVGVVMLAEAEIPAVPNLEPAIPPHKTRAAWTYEAQNRMLLTPVWIKVSSHVDRATMVKETLW
jgi:hypothetical protein